MSKIQKLSAIHNRSVVASVGVAVVYEYKDTKFEWNGHGMPCPYIKTTLIAVLED